jgi:hypothetical protein
MTIHEYLMKAREDDAQRAGERDRLLLEAQRPAGRAASVWFPPLRRGAWPGCCSAGRPHRASGRRVLVNPRARGAAVPVGISSPRRVSWA